MPHLTAGTWSGTMCLTEPQCGTDLGQVKTKAEPQADGTYNITGTKIFISAGEHDLTENIVHIVLARLPDAPAGTKGISLFIVPKFTPTTDGGVGERNPVTCGSIEHKMGIRASATAVLNFDAATGYLIGGTAQGSACHVYLYEHCTYWYSSSRYCTCRVVFPGCIAICQRAYVYACYQARKTLNKWQMQSFTMLTYAVCC